MEHLKHSEKTRNENCKAACDQAKRNDFLAHDVLTKLGVPEGRTEDYSTSTRGKIGYRQMRSGSKAEFEFDEKRYAVKIDTGSYKYDCGENTMQWDFPRGVDPWDALVHWRGNMSNCRIAIIEEGRSAPIVIAVNEGSYYSNDSRGSSRSFKVSIEFPGEPEIVIEERRRSLFDNDGYYVINGDSDSFRGGDKARLAAEKMEWVKRFLDELKAELSGQRTKYVPPAPVEDSIAPTPSSLQHATRETLGSRILRWLRGL